MLKKLILLLAFIFLVSCSFFVDIKPPKPEAEPEILSEPEALEEMRGAWVTRFSYADENPDSMKMKIKHTMKNLSDANFNAVFFQVRGQCETLYPSPFEPWSKLLNFQNPGFDPVKLAIEEARRNGLKFYAYINLLPMWSGSQLPADSTHIYYSHGPAADTSKQWILKSDDKNEQNITNYYYLNPAKAEVRGYLKKVVRHFVSTYDVDGLHFDRIRYPGATYLADHYSKESSQQDSIAKGVRKSDWARQQLTDLVESVVVEAKLIKPYLVMSAATWGLYRTDDMPGYEHFGSGYAKYYQDAIDWLDKGIMDFIVPMTYWDIDHPLPNFNDLWLDFKQRTDNYKHIFPGLRIYDCDWLDSGETARQVNFIRKNGGEGTVMFSLDHRRDKRYEIIRKTIYPEKQQLPQNLLRTDAENVFRLNITPVLDSSCVNAEVALKNYANTSLVDMNGDVDFILPEKRDPLTLTLGEKQLEIKTGGWYPPYKFTINADTTVSRREPWVEIRRFPARNTNIREYHFLYKTGYPAQVSINQDSVKLYKTGIFFKSVQFKEGSNRISAEVSFPDSSRTLYVKEFFYRQKEAKKPDISLWIDENSIQPVSDITLTSDDIVTISFKGTLKQKGKVHLLSTGKTVNCYRRDFAGFSIYEARLPMRYLKDERMSGIKLELTGNGQTHVYQPDITIKSLPEDEFPLVKTTSENSILNYTTGQIRLGGPIRAEYGPGVILKTIGETQEYYKVKLNDIEMAYIDKDEVEELSPLKRPPGYFITSMSCGPDKGADILRIPYLEPVPYTVYPEPDLNRIVIKLYGVKTSSTWLTHRKGRKMIDKVTWQQTTPETYTIYVNLKQANIWGYDIKPSGRSLVFRVKYPPAYDLAQDKPLSGLKIALEAGHGGRSTGAIGLSGIQEKDINLSLAFMLEEELKKKGAEVFQVRDRDTSMYLGEKRELARKSGADLFISIHANAAGTHHGYLGVSGTSTYYHNPFWAPFAEKVYDRLLNLGLLEFGVVGSFNYKVTRMSDMPAILVEQAFMTHAEDEEKLADDEFRQAMAEKIALGILDYLEFMRE